MLLLQHCNGDVCVLPRQKQREDVAERLHRVQLSASFLARLESIETFLTNAGAAFAYDRLLDDLRAVVIPNLRRFPRMGRRYVDRAPQSAEALTQLALLPDGAADALREYSHGDYLILYTVTERIVSLLSIRHYRQLSFDFTRPSPP